MKALVTGASGLVSGNLAIHLASRGNTVRCLRRGTSRVHHLDAILVYYDPATMCRRAALPFPSRVAVAATESEKEEAQDGSIRVQLES